MSIISSIANWLFFDSIYGIFLIALAGYALFWAIKRLVPKTPNPAFFAAAIGLIALLALPSVPRYQFEQKVESQINGKPWIRVVNKTKWGDLTEPLTYFAAPVGSFTLVMPNSPITGGFREIVMQYDKKPMVYMVDPDCKDHTVWYSTADGQGVFHYMTKTAQKMSKQDRETFCQYDWTHEREALRAEMLRGVTAKPIGGG